MADRAGWYRMLAQVADKLGRTSALSLRLAVLKQCRRGHDPSLNPHRGCGRRDSSERVAANCSTAFNADIGSPVRGVWRGLNHWSSGQHLAVERL
jgi:hypothetical protein